MSTTTRRLSTAELLDPAHKGSMITGSSWPYRAVVCICIAYIMLRPVSAGEILYPALAVVALVSLGAILFSRRVVAGPVLAVLAAAVVAALYGAFIGMDNPGLSQHLTVWLGGTLIYGLWALAADEKLIRPLTQVMAWATIALSVLIVVYVASQTGVLPDVLPSWLMEESGAGFNEDQGATAIRLYGLSTLVAAAPMWVTSAFVARHPYLPARWIRITAAILAVVAALLGGRNAIILVLVVVPPAIAIAARVIARRGRKRRGPMAILLMTWGVLAVPLLVFLATQNAAVQRTWSNIVLFVDGEGQSERVEQIDRLLKAWQESPFFGSGLGAVIPGYSRSTDRPWNFEMQYNMLLFQFGLVGAVLLIVVMLLAVRAVSLGFRARPDLAPVFWTAIAAAGGMLVANATNPYLQAPGHIWAVFFPLLVANVAILYPRTGDDLLGAKDLPPTASRTTAGR